MGLWSLQKHLYNCMVIMVEFISTIVWVSWLIDVDSLNVGLIPPTTHVSENFNIYEILLCPVCRSEYKKKPISDWGS